MSRHPIFVRRILRSDRRPKTKCRYITVFLERGDQEWAYSFDADTEKLLGWWEPHNPDALKVARRAAFDKSAKGENK
jgi:hypothetical protein